MLRILWSEESDSSNQHHVMAIKAKEVSWSGRQEERGMERERQEYKSLSQILTSL